MKKKSCGESVIVKLGIFYTVPAVRAEHEKKNNPVQ